MAVGFELYQKIIQEAVGRLKGEQLAMREELDPELTLSVPAWIPDFYVPDIAERLLLYQRTATITSEEDLTELREECEDRFGPIPPQTDSLFMLMHLKAILKAHGIMKIEIKNNALQLTLGKDAPLDLEKLLTLTQQHPKKYQLNKGLTLAISDPPDPSDIESINGIVVPILDYLTV
jgi:transcription-repair coupling factor (superfamily II helicase)